VAGCSSATPSPTVENALLEVPSANGHGTESAMALVGHLAGTPAPLGAKAKHAIYTPTETRVVLEGVTCGANLDAAYAKAGSKAQRVCKDGELTLSASGDAIEEWNPWKVDGWRVGPLAALPDVATGNTFKPNRITLHGNTALAELTPKQPSPFVDRLGSSMADTDWAVRPRPGGHSYHKGVWTAVIEQDGAQVTVHIEAAL